MPLFPKPVVPVIVACLALALLPFVLGQGQDFNTQQRVVLLPFPYNAGTESSFPTHFVVAVGGDIIFQVSNTVSASGLAVWSPITREPEALESSVGPLTIVTNTPGYHASRSNNVMDGRVAVFLARNNADLELGAVPSIRLYRLDVGTNIVRPVVLIGNATEQNVYDFVIKDSCIVFIRASDVQPTGATPSDQILYQCLDPSDNYNTVLSSGDFSTGAYPDKGKVFSVMNCNGRIAFMAHNASGVLTTVVVDSTANNLTHWVTSTVSILPQLSAPAYIKSPGIIMSSNHICIWFSGIQNATASIFIAFDPAKSVQDGYPYLLMPPYGARSAQNSYVPLGTGLAYLRGFGSLASAAFASRATSVPGFIFPLDQRLNITGCTGNASAIVATSTAAYISYRQTNADIICRYEPFSAGATEIATVPHNASSSSLVFQATWRSIAAGKTDALFLLTETQLFYFDSSTMSRAQLIDDVILNNLDSFAFVSDRYGVYPCKSDFYGVEICVLDVDTMTRTVVDVNKNLASLLYYGMNSPETQPVLLTTRSRAATQTLRDMKFGVVANAQSRYTTGKIEIHGATGWYSASSKTLRLGESVNNSTYVEKVLSVISDADNTVVFWVSTTQRGYITLARSDGSSELLRATDRITQLDSNDLFICNGYAVVNDEGSTALIYNLESRASQNVTLGSGTRLILTCDSPGASLLVLSYNVSLQTVELRRMRMGGDVLEPLHSFSEVTPSPALLSAELWNSDHLVIKRQSAGSIRMMTMSLGAAASYVEPCSAVTNYTQFMGSAPKEFYIQAQGSSFYRVGISPGSGWECESVLSTNGSLSFTLARNGDAYVWGNDTKVYSAFGGAAPTDFDSIIPPVANPRVVLNVWAYSVGLVVMVPGLDDTTQLVLLTSTGVKLVENTGTGLCIPRSSPIFLSEVNGRAVISAYSPSYGSRPYVLSGDIPFNCTEAPVPGAECIDGAWIVSAITTNSPTLSVASPILISGPVAIESNLTLLYQQSGTLIIMPGGCLTLNGATIIYAAPNVSSFASNTSVVLVDALNGCLNGDVANFRVQIAEMSCVRVTGEVEKLNRTNQIVARFVVDESGCEHTTAPGSQDDEFPTVVIIIFCVLGVVLIFGALFLGAFVAVRKCGQDDDELIIIPVAEVKPPDTEEQTSQESQAKEIPSESPRNNADAEPADAADPPPRRKNHTKSARKEP